MKHTRTRPRIFFSLILLAGILLAPHSGFGLTKHTGTEPDQLIKPATVETLAEPSLIIMLPVTSQFHNEATGTIYAEWRRD